MHPAFVASHSDAVPIWFATADTYSSVAGAFEPALRAAVEALGFEPRPGRLAVVPGHAARPAAVVFGLDAPNAPAGDRFLPGKLPTLLPPGTYRFANSPRDVRLAALSFALGSYRFARYKKVEREPVLLAVPEGVDAAELTRAADAVALARDLINTPANDMGPAELQAAAGELAGRHGAVMRVVIGEELRQQFPLIDAVGRGSLRAPRLIDITHGDAGAPKVTLVGKGVCFDTGGLDLKPSAAMLIMKKDMGGAACVLAAAHMILDARLPVRLRVLLPAVENAVSGGAFRPLDVYRARNGVTVEIGNTDAEGRLVLADALALADEEAPDLLVDMGTLTGAARVALGPDLPAFYTEDEELAVGFANAAEAENDPVWRLPLWRPYQAMLESKVADINNVSAGPFAGSITCALFLARFVSAAKSWLHCDLYAWNPSAKPARPEGGECQVARALYALLRKRYG